MREDGCTSTLVERTTFYMECVHHVRFSASHEGRVGVTGACFFLVERVWLFCALRRVRNASREDDTNNHAKKSNRAAENLHHENLHKELAILRIGESTCRSDRTDTHATNEVPQPHRESRRIRRVAAAVRIGAVPQRHWIHRHASNLHTHIHIYVHIYICSHVRSEPLHVLHVHDIVYSCIQVYDGLRASCRFIHSRFESVEYLLTENDRDNDAVQRDSFTEDDRNQIQRPNARNTDCSAHQARANQQNSPVQHGQTDIHTYNNTNAFSTSKSIPQIDSSSSFTSQDKQTHTRTTRHLQRTCRYTERIQLT